MQVLLQEIVSIKCRSRRSQ